MIKSLLFALLLCGWLPLLQAQSEEVHDAGVIFATEFCKCINPQLKTMRPDVVKVLMGMPDDPDEIEGYLQQFDEETFNNFTEDMQQLETFGSGDDYLACMDGIENKLERFKDKLEAYYDDPAFLDAVLGDLKRTSKCQLAYIFFKIALQSGSDDGN